MRRQRAQRSTTKYEWHNSANAEDRSLRRRKKYRRCYRIEKVLSFSRPACFSHFNDNFWMETFATRFTLLQYAHNGALVRSTRFWLRRLQLQPNTLANDGDGERRQNIYLILFGCLNAAVSGVCVRRSGGNLIYLANNVRHKIAYSLEMVSTVDTAFICAYNELFFVFKLRYAVDGFGCTIRPEHVIEGNWRISQNSFARHRLRGIDSGVVGRLTTK